MPYIYIIAGLTLLIMVALVMYSCIADEDKAHFTFHQKQLYRVFLSVNTKYGINTCSFVLNATSESEAVSIMRTWFEETHNSDETLVEGSVYARKEALK